MNQLTHKPFLSLVPSGLTTDLQDALRLADTWSRGVDLAGQESPAALLALRVRGEAARAVARSWLAAARRSMRPAHFSNPPQHYTRIEDAERVLATGIASIHVEIVRRKEEAEAQRRGSPPQDAGHTATHAPEAEEAARRLAAEVERLQSQLAELGEASFYKEFYETARVVLAENTVDRIASRARDSLRRKRGAQGR